MLRVDATLENQFQLHFVLSVVILHQKKEVTRKFMHLLSSPTLFRTFQFKNSEPI